MSTEAADGNSAAAVLEAQGTWGYRKLEGEEGFLSYRLWGKHGLAHSLVLDFWPSTL